MNEEYVNIAVVVTSVAAIAVSGLYAVKIIKEGRQKREQIKKDYQLDSEAIKRATTKMRTDIKAGKYDGKFYELYNDLDDSIEFEKIAIRF